MNNRANDNGNSVLTGYVSAAVRAAVKYNRRRWNGLQARKFYGHWCVCCDVWRMGG